MESFIQIAALILAEHLFDKYVFLSSTTKHNSRGLEEISKELNKLQTSVWRYKSSPSNQQTLLFDFSNCPFFYAIKQDQQKSIIACIQSCLPAHVTVSIQFLSNFLVELMIPNNDYPHLHQQTFSILQHKGLHIKNLWIKPTLTLHPSSKLRYWRLCLYDVPLIYLQNLTTSQEKDRVRTNIANEVSQAFKSCHGHLFIIQNVYFNTETKLENTSGYITMLGEEWVNSKTSITKQPLRTLIYLSCLKRYFPITTTLIEK
ncbi:MAG: hypothetical protein EXX96DRAFT_544754 [Benjaminiella poitrasii]|nr:MAG: hypothetical protein EXX96DRAFT_544754 [Benjaminiella poitrasii]